MAKSGPKPKYRFGQLTKRGRRINVRTSDPERVRGAAYSFAKTRGWRISAHMTPQGLSVTRVG